MPFYTPNPNQSPQPWNPDWGRGTEMMGTFPTIPQTNNDPEQFRKSAVPGQSLSYVRQMYGGKVTDPDTGEEYYLKFQAPPEPEGIQSWHQGIMEGEWADQDRAAPFYFAKKEEAPWTQASVDNISPALLYNNDYSSLRQDQESRARYAQAGRPVVKNTFPGLRELPPNYGDGYIGFHKRRVVAAPTPLTGKEFVGHGWEGRTISHGGGQGVLAMPYVSAQTAKGSEALRNSHTAPMYGGGMPHSSDPLMDSIRNANAQYTLDAQPTNNYAIGNTNLQRVAAAHKTAPVYSTQRARYTLDADTTSRVALMRFGRTPGSTRLASSGGQMPDYVSGHKYATFTPVQGFHPIESVTAAMAEPEYETIMHRQSDVVGAQARTHEHTTYDAVGEYETETLQRTEPETSVRVESQPSAGQYARETEQFKLSAARVEPGTNVRVESHSQTGQYYARETDQYKLSAARVEPETNVRVESQPYAGQYARETYMPTSLAARVNPETSVRVQTLEPFAGSIANKPYTNRPSLAQIGQGRSSTQALPQSGLFDRTTVPKQEFLNRNGHGVYQGQLTTSVMPLVTEGKQTLSKRFEADLYQLERQQVTSTLVNGGQRIQTYEDTPSENLFVQQPRAQYLFPPIN